MLAGQGFCGWLVRTSARGCLPSAGKSRGMDGAQESPAKGKLLWLGSIALARDNISDRIKGQGFITLLFSDGESEDCITVQFNFITPLLWTGCKGV